MRRAMLYFVAIFSTLMLAVVVGDWNHSLNQSETWICVRGGRIYAIDNFDGEAAFWIGTMKDAEPDGCHHEHWPLSNARKTIDLGIQNPAGRDWWFARFGYTTRHRFPTTVTQSIDPRRVTGYRGFVVPLWFLTLVFAVIPVIATTRLIRSRRRQAFGLCAVCGYDLRASPERCPECGTPARQSSDAPVARASRPC